tara:strand:- start:11798 stop:12445 length:648 start_codon:yes stop_codon:yes gene_type:complete
MKDLIKSYIKNHSEDSIKIAMEFMEIRAEKILSKNDWYKDLYIDPNVDIVNSHPQVIQQVRKEIKDFLNLLQSNDVNNMLQIGLGHWASTHFVLSLLINNITTIEYDPKHIERYSTEMCNNCEKVVQGDSLDYHKNIEDETYDAVFIDGNHSYEYVKQDLENYSKKVKRGGIIALHDANFEGEQYGTPKVLRESDHEWSFISHSNEVGIAYRIKD